MNILYSGKYKNRFTDVISLIEKNGSKSVVELCFGDIYIARYCKANDIKWIGYDISEYFVLTAKKNGFNAIKKDILKLNVYDPADTCVMVGSLYHFHDQVELLLSALLKNYKHIIISEPIKNLTNSNSFFKFISNKLTNAGKGTEAFRYNENTFIKEFNSFSKKLNFKYNVIKKNRDILIEIKND